ncbi:hypothetical protein [Nocardia sp. CA-290969]|uniref:hypothetical protein n=1 Tax=Nocardia sp. CA-290969 TaxID=3239986 RepID=UPI003D8EE3FF
MLLALGLIVQITFSAALLFIVGGLIVQRFTRPTEYVMTDTHDTITLPQIPTARAVVITGDAGGDVEVDYHPPNPRRDYAGAAAVVIGEHTKLVLESVDDLRALMADLARVEDQWTRDLGLDGEGAGRHARGASNGYPDADALHIEAVAAGAGA